MKPVRARRCGAKEGERCEQTPGYRDNQDRARDYHPEPSLPSARSESWDRAPH
jgi:hypothetical protein